MVGAVLVPAAPPAAAEVAHPIIFPVVGDVTYSDTWGAPRSGGRTHQGQDIFAPKMRELVAVADGVISFITIPEASYGYILRITADDGWVYSYVHVNNDTPGTDDGNANLSDVFAPGIEKGARVHAGQQVAFNGDSGNAENTSPHLHFEMKTPDGRTIDPLDSLDAAQRLDAPIGAEPVEPSPIPRLAGTDRVGTAIAVAKAGWPSGAGEVVIAAGDSYAEALPATVLAGKLDGPLLLVTSSRLSTELAAEIDRLGPRRAHVIGSVPVGVEADLVAKGIEVRRVGGANDSVATAVAVANTVGGGSGTAVVVNRQRFADGVSASAIAAGRNWPVLLSDASTVPQESVDTWRALGIRRLVIVGGTGVVGQNISDFMASSGGCAGNPGCEVTRLAGTERYATSVAVVDASIALGGRSPARLLMATGTAYPDALGAGPLADRQGGALVLVDGSGAGHDQASRAWIADHADQVDSPVILGGSAAVRTRSDQTIQDALGL